MAATGKKLPREGRKKGSGLSDFPASQLQAELERRQRRVRTLKRRYERLMKSANALRSEIAALGGAAGAQGTISTGQGTRPRNDVNLVEALKQAMGNRTMTISEAADAVLKAGYSTTSQFFRQIVNITLIRSGEFARVARGKYRAK